MLKLYLGDFVGLFVLELAVKKNRKFHQHPGIEKVQTRIGKSRMSYHLFKELQIILSVLIIVHIFFSVSSVSKDIF